MSDICAYRCSTFIEHVSGPTEGDVVHCNTHLRYRWRCVDCVVRAGRVAVQVQAQEQEAESWRQKYVIAVDSCDLVFVE